MPRVYDVCEDTVVLCYRKPAFTLPSQRACYSVHLCIYLRPHIASICFYFPLCEFSELMKVALFSTRFLQHERVSQQAVWLLHAMYYTALAADASRASLAACLPMTAPCGRHPLT